MTTSFLLFPNYSRIFLSMHCYFLYYGTRVGVAYAGVGVLLFLFEREVLFCVYNPSLRLCARFLSLSMGLDYFAAGLSVFRVSAKHVETCCFETCCCFVLMKWSKANVGYFSGKKYRTSVSYAFDMKVLNPCRVECRN